MRWLFLLILLLAQPVFAQTLAGQMGGRVTAVESGDTMSIQDAQRRQYKVRLLGAAAPERTQPFGPQARVNLSALVFNREVDTVGERRDGQGHRLVKVLVAAPNCNDPACPKRTDVGLAQIASGMAWWDRAASDAQTPREREDYEGAEFNAKLRRFGLWTGKNPVPPWEWRGR